MRQFIGISIAIAITTPWAPAALAQATGVTGIAGAYLVHERAEVDTPAGEVSDSDLGFGLKAYAEFTERYLGFVEFQDAKLSSFRLGGGALFPANVDTDWIAAAALVDKDADDGIGFFAGAQHRPVRQLEVRGTLGLLILDDFNGVELDLSGTYRIDRYWSGIAGLRMFQGNGPGTVDFRTAEFHVGGAYNFNL